MALSIVFPAYNEELNVENSVHQALAYLKDKEGEVIVVNDGSTDRTAELLEGLVRRFPGRVRAIHHAQNRGYAPTLRDGFLAAKGDWVFYTDADNQFVLGEIDRLTALSEGADLVIGYRADRQDPAFRKFTARIYNSMVHFVFGLRGVRDIDCAFKLFRRSVFNRIQIESRHFLIDAEILIKAQRLGMVIRETAVTHLPRKSGRSTVKPKHVLLTLIGLARLYWRVKTRPLT
ncbi:MAG: glycosyltransferase family 2 protein [Pseudomonadota bacterium]